VGEPDLRIVLWSDAPFDFASRLSRMTGVRVVCQSITLSGAWRGVVTSQPDIVIVATRTAGADAPSLVHRLPPERRPLLIVITDRPADAVAAFELGAVDCFSRGEFDRRIAEAVCRVRQRQAQDHLAHRVTHMARQLHSERSPHPVGHIDVPKNGEQLRIATSDIECVESCGNYVRVVTANGEYLHRATLTQFARWLRGCGFFRAHRRFLVNEQHVTSRTRGGELCLRSGRRIQSSRSYRKNVMDFSSAHSDRRATIGSIREARRAGR
jgi:DNA-binding LytR/AlgR family response regulator